MKLKKPVYPRAYYRGREAREAGEPKHRTGKLNAVERSWWLAGWNDCDLEKRQ